MFNKVKLKVELLQHNADSENAIALAAKLCYSNSDILSLKEKISKNEQTKFIENVASMGHYSVFEHISFTFGIEGVSRALTHQLVRHRVASFSQQSQRYVKNSGGFNFITPETIANDDKALLEFDEVMKTLANAYDKLIGLGIPPEDARYLLPNAAETKIIVTMNARELLHFFAIRSCERAQWEIRAMSDEMLRLAYKVAPSVFAKAGPSCVYGKCSEGKFTCGKQSEVKERINSLKITEK